MKTKKMIAEVEHVAGCLCCRIKPQLGVDCFLDIHVTTPNDDTRLVVLLYHNWLTPDTAYLIFGQTYRILGLYPPNPLLQLLRWGPNED